MSHLIWIYNVCFFILLFFSISNFAVFFQDLSNTPFNTMDSSTLLQVKVEEFTSDGSYGSTLFAFSFFFLNLNFCSFFCRICLTALFNTMDFYNSKWKSLPQKCISGHECYKLRFLLSDIVMCLYFIVYTQKCRGYSNFLND